MGSPVSDHISLSRYLPFRHKVTCSISTCQFKDTNQHKLCDGHTHCNGLTGSGNGNIGPNHHFRLYQSIPYYRCPTPILTTLLSSHQNPMATPGIPI